MVIAVQFLINSILLPLTLEPRLEDSTPSTGVTGRGSGHTGVECVTYQDIPPLDQLLHQAVYDLPEDCQHWTGGVVLNHRLQICLSCRHVLLNNISLFER